MFYNQLHTIVLFWILSEILNGRVLIRYDDSSEGARVGSSDRDVLSTAEQNRDMVINLYDR